MEVILQQDFPSLGYVGDTVKVRPGYARNYLIPRGVVVEANITNKRLLRHRLSQITAKRVRLRSDAEEIKKQLESIKLEFMLRVGAGGRTFGSITARDVEAALAEKGHKLDRRQIRLSDSLKKVGEHRVAIKLHGDVHADVVVQINSELPQKSAQESESGREKSAKPGQKRRSKKTKSSEEDQTVSQQAEPGAEDATDNDADKQAAQKSVEKKSVEP